MPTADYEQLTVDGQPTIPDYHDVYETIDPIHPDTKVRDLLSVDRWVRAAFILGAALHRAGVLSPLAHCPLPNPEPDCSLTARSCELTM